MSYMLQANAKHAMAHQTQAYRPWQSSSMVRPGGTRMRLTSRAEVSVSWAAVASRLRVTRASGLLYRDEHLIV